MRQHFLKIAYEAGSMAAIDEYAQKAMAQGQGWKFDPALPHAQNLAAAKKYLGGSGASSQHIQELLSQIPH